MDDTTFDLIVIGAGPGGYVAAIRAAQLGMRVAVVEKRRRLGGVCLNEGCIPSKALLDSSELYAMASRGLAVHGIEVDPPRLDLAAMMARKQEVVKRLTEGIAFLFKKNGITLFTGTARLAGPQEGDRQAVAVSAEDASEPDHQLYSPEILLATGSIPVEIPALAFNGTSVIGSREALALERVPDHLVVVGGGFIGLELGSVWSRLGAKVTVVEALPHILSNTDRQLTEALVRSLKRQGLTILTDSRVSGYEERKRATVVQIESGESHRELSCDKVLIAVGRKPLTEGLGLEEAGVRLDDRGRVRVDERFATDARGISAIGDLIDGPMLAHKAMEEGIAFAERLAGHFARVEYDLVPAIVYTWPEAASVGRTEESLKDADIAYRVGKFPFGASGRAKCLEATEGFVKILATPDSGKVLGVHILGPHASELISEAVTVMSFGGSIRDIAVTFHAHPTLSEAVREAALAVEKRAIHM